MTKKRYKIFPDYASSGIWAFPSGGNIDESNIDNIVPPILMMALKYWHHTWEASNEFWIKNNNFRIMKEFDADGELLVEQMNESQDTYQFIYVSSFYRQTHSNRV